MGKSIKEALGMGGGGKSRKTHHGKMGVKQKRRKGEEEKIHEKISPPKVNKKGKCVCVCVTIMSARNDRVLCNPPPVPPSADGWAGQDLTRAISCLFITVVS